MAVDTYEWPQDPAFTERVLQRVEAVERRRRRRQRLRYLLPLVTAAVISAAWAVALLTGTTAIRVLIEAVAWLRVADTIEQHLSNALLGPFAPFPSIVSLLLFLAAIGWVRLHQPGPPGWRP